VTVDPFQRFDEIAGNQRRLAVAFTFLPPDVFNLFATRDLTTCPPDQFNNRVVEVDPAAHGVVWSFRDGSYIAGPHFVVGTNVAERIGDGQTLISGTGTPGWG
jgi:hypothetical protein